MLVGEERPVADVAHIERQHADAVAVVAGKVGGDKVFRDRARFLRRRAAGGKDRGDALGQRARIGDNLAVGLRLKRQSPSLSCGIRHAAG